MTEYDIQQNEHFVQYVFMPYFKDIYKDLSARSDKPNKGINRLVFLDVSYTQVSMTTIFTIHLDCFESYQHGVNYSLLYIVR